MIYDKNFQEEEIEKSQMFSSFLSAMKAFVSDLIMKGSKESKNIELGDYTVSITGIPKINIDLVIIADKEDIKSVNKLIPKFIKFLLKCEEIFLSWDGKKEIFDILENPITKLIYDNLKSFRKSIPIKPEQVLESIWASTKHLSEESRNGLIQERDMLIFKMENMIVLPPKLALAEKIIQLSNELKDEDTKIRFQNEINKIKKEIDDTKLKLNFYLGKIKNTLSYAIENLGDKPINSGDFKNTYLNLYSFSTKLKLLKEKGWEIYRELANKLIEKDSISEHELNDVIKKILAMSPDINNYLND
ncbi:MAG: hypothetical protein ACFFKA_06365 [Candidatus Thorarchaeota archaeon]